MPTPILSSRTILGSYGELFSVTGAGAGTETFMAGINGFEAKLVVEKKDIKRAGTKMMGYKRGLITGEGTMKGMKVTSGFLQRFVDEIGGTTPPPLKLRSKLDDPEALGAEIITFLHVSLWEIPMGWMAGEVVEEDIPFTFEDFTLDTAITGNPAAPLV